MNYENMSDEELLKPDVSADYSKMSDDELLKPDVSNSYSNMSDEELLKPDDINKSPYENDIESARKRRGELTTQMKNWGMANRTESDANAKEMEDIDRKLMWHDTEKLDNANKTVSWGNGVSMKDGETYDDGNGEYFRFDYEKARNGEDPRIPVSRGEYDKTHYDYAKDNVDDGMLRPEMTNTDILKAEKHRNENRAKAQRGAKDALAHYADRFGKANGKVTFGAEELAADDIDANDADAQSAKQSLDDHGRNIRHDRPMHFDRDENGKITGYGTTRSMVVEELDGTYSVIPTIRGEQGHTVEMTPEEAKAWYRKTQANDKKHEPGEREGERWGNYATLEDAERASKDVSALHRKMYQNKWNQYVREHWDEMADSVKNAPGVKEDYDAWVALGSPRVEVDLEELRKNRETGEAEKPKVARTILEDVQANYQAETGEDVSKAYAALHNIIPYLKTSDKIDAASEQARLEKQLDESYRKGDWEKNMEARYELEEHARIKDKARQFLDKTYLPWYKKPVAGGIENTGYTLEYVLAAGVGSALGAAGMVGAKAMDVAMPAATAAYNRFGELTANDYGVDENGNLVMSVEGDEKSMAATKAIVGGIAEAVIEKYLFDNPATKALGKTAVARQIRGKFMESVAKSKIGNAWLKTVEGFNKLGKFTAQQGTEVLEEDAQAIVDDVLGMGRRADEAYNGSDTLTWKGQLDILLNMLGTMGAQGAVGYAMERMGERARNKAYSAQAKTIYDIPGLDKQLVDNMSDYEKAKFVGFYNKYSGNAEKLNEVADRLFGVNGKVELALRNAAQRNNVEMDRALEERGVTPENFVIPTDENGNVAFTPKQIVDPIKGTRGVYPVAEDNAHGVSIVDVGSGRTFVVMDQNRAEYYGFNDLDSAKTFADGIVKLNQKKDLDNRVKVEYATELAQKNKVNVDVVESLAQLKQMVGDRDAQQMYASGATRFVANGKVMLILDNCTTPAVMDHAVAQGAQSAQKQENGEVNHAENAFIELDAPPEAPVREVTTGPAAPETDENADFGDEEAALDAAQGENVDTTVENAPKTPVEASEGAGQKNVPTEAETPQEAVVEADKDNVSLKIDEGSIRKTSSEVAKSIANTLKPGQVATLDIGGGRKIAVSLDNKGTYRFSAILEDGTEVPMQSTYASGALDFGVENALRFASKSANGRKFDAVIRNIENRISELGKELKSAEKANDTEKANGLRERIDTLNSLLSDVKANKKRYESGSGIKEMPWDRWQRWMDEDAETDKAERESQAEAKSEPVVSKTETATDGVSTSVEKPSETGAKQAETVSDVSKVDTKPSKVDTKPSKTGDGIPTVDALPTEEVSNGKKGKRAKSKTWAVGEVGDKARLADGSVHQIYATEAGRKKWGCVESATRNGKPGVKLGQHFTTPEDANAETVKTEGELGEHQDWKVASIDNNGREITLKPANTEAWTESHKFTRPSISGLSGDAVADLVDTTLSDKRYDAEGLQDAITWASNLLGKRNKSATMGVIAWGKGKNVLGAGPLRKRIEAAVAKAQQRKDALTKANINVRNKRLANIAIDKGVISSYVKNNPDSLLAAWMEDVGETDSEKIRKMLSGESDSIDRNTTYDEMVEMANFLSKDANGVVNHLELPKLAEQIIGEMDKAERTFKKEDDYEAYLRDQEEAQDADEQAVVQQLIEDKAEYDALRWSENGNNAIMSDGTVYAVKNLENGDFEITDRDSGETFVIYADEPSYEELFNENESGEESKATVGTPQGVVGTQGGNREETAGAEPVPGRGRRAGSPKRNASAYRGLVNKNATPEEIAARDEVLKNGGAVTLLDPEWFASDDSVNNIVIPKLKIESDADAAALIQDYLYDPGKEKAKALYIYEGTNGDIGVIKVVGIGNVGMTTSGIDEVVAGVSPGCKKVIYSHNHVSGDVTRSDADVKVTENLRNAMFRAHPEVSVDHIITDTDRFYSFNSGNVTLAEIVPDNGARAVPYKDRTIASKGEIVRICNSLSSVQNENATWLVGMGAHDEIMGMVALPSDGDFKRALAAIPGARRFAVAIGKTPFDRQSFLDELDTAGKDQHGRPLRKITYIVENGEATEFYADKQDAARAAFLNGKKEAPVVQNETPAQQANREYFDKLGEIDGVHFTRSGDMVWLHGYDRKKVVKDELKKHGFKWGAFKGRDGQWHGIQAFGIAYGDIPQNSSLLGKIDETEGATQAALDADSKTYSEKKNKTVEQRKAEKKAEAASVAEKRRDGYKQTQEQVENDNSALADIDLDNLLAEGETEVSPTWEGDMLAEGENEIQRPTTAMDKVFAVGVRRASNFLANGIGTKFADFVRYADETFGDKAAKLRKFYPTWYLEAGIDMGEDVRDQMDDSIAVDRMAREMFGLTPRGKDKPGQRVAYVVQEHLLPFVEQKVTAESYNRGLDADQQLGVNLALNAVAKPDGSFMLADGTGFGKTRQILAIADQYKKSNPGASVLILTKSQNIIADSFAKDSESMGIDIGQFTVGTYDGLRAGKFTPVKDGLGLNNDWDLVLLDEAHKLANSASATAQEYANLPVKHTVFATATPMDRTTDAAYFMAKLNNSDPQTIARSLGYQLVTLNNNGNEYVVAQTVNGMDEESIRRAIIMERDKAIASGKMIRRAYPFLGDIDTGRKVGMTDAHRKNEAEIVRFYTDEINRLRLAKKIWMDGERGKRGTYYFKGGVPRGQFGVAVNPNEWDGIVSKRKHQLLNKQVQAYDALNESMKASEAAKMAKDILAKEPGARIIICGTQKGEHHITGGFAESDKAMKLEGLRKDTKGKATVYAVEPSLSVADKALREAGITDIAHIYTGYDKAEEQQDFVSGRKNVLLMTDKSGGTGINLDDTTGEHPTYLLVLSPNYSAKEIDQLMGRVSRKNTKSLAHVLFLTNDSISDTHRANVTQKKLGVLKAIQGGADADALLPMGNESDTDTDGTMLAEGEDEAPSRSQMTENYITKAILDSTLLDPMAKQYSGYTDKVLVEKALDDDVLAFNALYRKYMKQSGLPGIIRRVANKYGATVNDAMIDAITSDVWSHPTRGVIAELRTKPETYRTYAFSTILFGKAGNFFKDNLNALKRQGALTLDQPSMSRRNTDDIDQMTADSPDAATAFTGGRVASETRGDTIGVKRRMDARDRLQDIILQLNDDDARMFKEVYAYELSRGDRPKGSSDKITDEEGRKIAAKIKKPYGVFVSEWRDLMNKIRTNEIDTLGYLAGGVEGSRYSPFELIDMMREQDLNDMADVVELREKGMNYAQIANELDMEENAVRTQISRAHRDFDYRPSMSMAPSGMAVQDEFYLDDNEVFVERKKPTAKKKIAESPYAQDMLFEGERERVTPAEDVAYMDAVKRGDGYANARTEKFAPNGKRSNLSNALYHLVRTKRFKEWFGDWESVSLQRFLEGEPVANARGDEYLNVKDTYALRDLIYDGYKRVNWKSVNPTLGTVELTKSGIRDSIGKGIGREKISAFDYIPEIIENGMVVNYENNWKGRGYDTSVITAPISIGGNQYAAFVVVRKHSNGSNNFYLHEVGLVEDIKKEAERLRTGSSDNSALSRSSGSVKSIALSIFSVNPDSVSNVIDENGEPLVVYHGTNKVFTEFSKEKQGYDPGFFFAENRTRPKDGWTKEYAEYYGGITISVFLRNAEYMGRGEWRVNESTDIKSADPVTYVPLSERFNAEKDSILYEGEDEVGMGMDNVSREDFFKSHKIEAFAKRKGRTVEDLQKKLNREISNYENARRQIDDMAASGKFAPTDDQQVLIGWFLKEARDEFDADWQGQMAAEANGDDALAKDLARKMENVRPWLMKLERLNDRLGSEWGRAGRARQLRIMQDYSLANQIVQAEKQAGRALTKEEIDELRPLCERLRESGIKLDAAKMEQLDFMIKSLVDSWINGEKRRVDVDRKLGKGDKKIEMEYETALRQMAFYKDRVITVIPDVKKWLNAIVRHHLLVGDIYKADGKVDEPKAVEVVIRDVGGQGVMATDWQVRQILTDMGKSTVPPQNKLERDRRELNTQMLIEQQIAYMLKHGEMPPVTGYMRDVQSMAVRELRKRRDAVINEMGLNADKEEGRLKSALDRAKRNVMNRIEEIRAAIAKGERIPKDKRTPNQDAELLALKADLKHEKDLYDAAFPKTEEELFEATVRRTLGAMKASGDYWKKRIENARNGIFDKEDKTFVSTPEIEAMRKANEAMKDEFEALKEAAWPEGTPKEIERKCAAREKHLLSQIEKKDEQIRAYENANTFEERRKAFEKDTRKDKLMTPKIAALEVEDANRRQKIEEFKRNLAEEDSTIADKILRNADDFLSVSRIMRTVLDASATFTQAGAYSLGSPIEAAKALGKSMMAVSEKHGDVINQMLRNDLYFDDFAKMGGHVYGNVEGRPEVFRGMNRFVGRIPGIRAIAGASERAFATYLNVFAISQYKALVNSPAFGPGGPTEAQRRRLAAFVNTALGYGYGSKGKSSHALADVALWAPRLMAASVKTAFAYDTWGQAFGGKRSEYGAKERFQTARVIGSKWAKAMAAGAALQVLMNMLWADDDGDKWDTFKDLTSGDFMTAKQGRIHFTGSMGRYARWWQLLAMAITGDKNGKRFDLDSAAWRKLSGAFNPSLALVWDLVRRRDFVGNEIDWGKFSPKGNDEKVVGALPHVFESTVVPLFVADMYDSLVQNGVGKTAVMAIPMFLGMGVKTYDNDKLKAVDESAKRYLNGMKKKKTEAEEMGEQELADKIEKEADGKVGKESARGKAYEKAVGVLKIERKLESINKQLRGLNPSAKSYEKLSKDRDELKKKLERKNPETGKTLREEAEEAARKLKWHSPTSWE